MSTTRAGRAAFRAMTVAAGRSRTIALAGMPAASARASSARRADGSTLVASTTAICPFASRRSRASWSTAKAALVAAWFASSPETIRPERVGRQDLVGREMARREGRLAGAGRADEDDQARVGEDDLGHDR